MTKLSPETIVSEALDLLDELGLDAVSTRRLARRLGVKQPSLYGHFRNKAALLRAMAAAAMAAHASQSLPSPSDDWRGWFLENYRSFRQTLLMHRDGARLHAGTTPQNEDLSRALDKLGFLVASGLPEGDARMAMLTAGRFTVGSVLEEQADADHDTKEDQDLDPAAAFDAGLTLIVDGLVRCTDRDSTRQ